MAHIRIHSTIRTICIFLSAFSFALEVAVDSPCAPQCIDNPPGNASDPNASLTFNRDLFCYDWEVIGQNSTSTGRKFKECNNCLKSSGYASTTVDERDMMWFLFNNRGVVDWCLFGRFAEEQNKNISESSVYKTCNNSCNKLYTAADYTIKSNLDSYSFCDVAGNFSSDADSCLTCLYNTPGLTLLGNVLATVVDLCEKKPSKTYDFPKDQEIYAATKITLARSAATSNSSSSASPSPTASTSPKIGSTGLSKGALAGIVLGGLVAIAAILAGILLLLKRKQNNNKTMTVSQENGETAYAGAGNYQYNPMGDSQKDRYAYRPTELAGHNAPSELPARDTASVRRH